MRNRSVLALLCLMAVGTLVANAGPRLYSVGAGQVRGQPAIEEGKVSGIFIWSDRSGLHLRWTTDGKPLLFSGRLDLDKPLREMKRVSDEAGGWAKAHGKRVIMFSSTSRKEIDGLDLVIPGGRRVRMELQIDGKEPAIEQVFFGAKGSHPKGFPLSVNLM